MGFSMEDQPPDKEDNKVLWANSQLLPQLAAGVFSVLTLPIDDPLTAYPWCRSPLADKKLLPFSCWVNYYKISLQMIYSSSK